MRSDLADQFESLWQYRGGSPDVVAFLGQHADCEASDQVAVLLRDQRYRWTTNRPLKVEDYLARLPQLSNDPTIRLQLAVGEFQARQAGDRLPEIEEFVGRFSDIGDALRSILWDVTSEETQDEKRQEVAATPALVSESAIANQRIGRYRLVRLLGLGAFGRVYLAFDDEIQRQVAIKVPMADRFQTPEDAEAYLAEARTVATLDHPNIVPVYDVGRTKDGSVYVVSKFIGGRTLRERMIENPLTHDEATRLLAIVARALHHAHQKRIVHRDIKPANLLIDDHTGTPYVADFGLAIREDVHMGNRWVAGTPAFMSPEQVRGEGHRLDGRSDVFSLGVVFYQVLTGKKPFRGSSSNEIFHQVLSVDANPPRELDDSIPGELERICLKALAKRASERYATAAELADDLLYWNRRPEREHLELKIVPKGLRAFDADDADFFLDLLPGHQDRNGLPESIRFWRTRLEETDPDRTFSVGLIYGPSGCGKSSRMKAGLLPRLSTEVVAIYVEATPDAAETRILRALHRRLPELPTELGLVETFTLLRVREGKKVVVVLDQFEQWLHAHEAVSETELVSAVRQCDGGQLQVVIMVRDDFAMATARFMDSLDIPIQQGHNFATVDLFDVEHARKVLTKFGQAFGKLPERTGSLSEAQQEFVHAAASGLAQESKVVSVRLALLAEMVKDKPWVPATLEEVGGTTGIGVNFLEETFNARTANPKHRIHQKAAREVLNSLLPEVGTDILGHTRSHAELLEASGYESRPEGFHDLLRILDGELRLITPTDPEGSQSVSGNDLSSKCYQLTHDYLVTPLRQWLTSKQRETRRGRAEIRLGERAKLWTARPEAKQLPSVWEWLSIRLNTARSRWSTTEQAMMRAATKHHLLRMLQLATIVIVSLVVGSGWWYRARKQTQTDRIDGLVSDLWTTKFEHLPLLLDELDPYRARWETRVSSAANSTSSSDRRTRACLALVRTEGDHLDYLHRQMLEADSARQRILRDELRPWQQELSRITWASTRNAKISDEQLIRGATILADYTPGHPGWQELAPAAVNSLVGSDPLLVNPWVDALYPVRSHLLAPLLNVGSGSGSSSNERMLAASVLASFAGRDEAFMDTKALSNLLLNSEPTVIRILEPVIRQRRASVLPVLRDELALAVPIVASGENERRLSRQTNAVEVLFRLGDAGPLWSHLGDEADPRLRTRLIDRLSRLDGDWRQLTQRLPQVPDPRARQAIVMGLAGHQGGLSAAAQRELTDLLLEMFRSDPDVGVHAAVDWLLRSLGAAEPLQTLKQQLAATGYRHGNWSIEPDGFTMVHIPAPGVFSIGWPYGEATRDGRETDRKVSIEYSFAISSSEITLRQFRKFQPDVEYAYDVTPDPECPINLIVMYDAMRFCRWLSEREPDFDTAACCYPPLEEIGPGMQLAVNYQRRSGYRLPTIAEWEYAARAGSQTSRFFGNSDSHLDRYCWFAANSEERTWPVGKLRPNPLGLFDVYGNVAEWCHRGEAMWEAASQPIRGGGYRSTPRFLRADMPESLDAHRRLSVVGFRIVKILETD